MLTSRTPLRASNDASLAPRWHTAALVALQVSVALCGTLLARYGAPSSAVSATPQAGSRIFSQYLPLLVVNFGLVAYCVFFFRPRHALPALLGERWHSVRRAAVDCSIALATCVVICGSELAFAHFTHVRRNAAIAALLPSGVAERLTWILVAVCVGFCEEVVYRGYLQTQLSAFSGRAALGIALQGILFGIAHLDQGPAVALRIAAYGCFFGLITRFRRSLLPSITAHIAIDLASGLLR